MSAVQKMPLSGFVTLQRGFDLPTTRRKVGDVPVVASTGIAGYHNEAKVQGPGVVIGRSGSIGGGQYMPEDFWPLNTTLWIKDFKGNNPRFTYYLLKSIDFTRFNAGAGVPTLNRNHIASVQVPSYGENAQGRIASILSAYDDLIENNRRRIQVLEQAARLLYKEWFVHLRFPGHEHVTIIDGVPEGWEVKQLQDLTEPERPVTYGVVKPGPEDENGITFVRGGDILDGGIAIGTLRTITRDVSEQYKRTLLRGGELLVSLVGNPGEVAIAPNELAGANLARQVGMVAISDPVIATFVCHYFSSQRGRSELLLYQKGAVQRVLNLSDLKRMSVLLPRKVLLNEAVGLIVEFDKQQETLRRMNRGLAAARDLLLPRLMNGELAV